MTASVITVSAVGVTLLVPHDIQQREAEFESGPFAAALPFRTTRGSRRADVESQSVASSHSGTALYEKENSQLAQYLAAQLHDLR